MGRLLDRAGAAAAADVVVVGSTIAHCTAHTVAPRLNFGEARKDVFSECQYMKPLSLFTDIDVAGVPWPLEPVPCNMYV